MTVLQKISARLHGARRIREAIDSYPGGVCIAASDGRPILANRTINELCAGLLGHTVMNAEEVWEALSAGVPPECGTKLAIPAMEQSGDGTLIYLLPDKAVWQIQRQSIFVDNAEYIQLEAEEITELYQYGKQLYENNRRLAALHERQRQLIDDIVQINLDRELLRAKMRIHDEFGRCLLATKNALGEHTLARDAAGLSAEWENTILSMANISEKRESPSPESELMKVAELIGCRVEFAGKQPTERTALLLLYAAVREALTNAVRHASADTLKVAISDDGKLYHVEISSNGTKRVSAIREGNGLGDLRRRLEQEGATMTVRCDGGVTLILTLPKEEDG